jgi:paraquat-inducible protein B
MKRTRAAVVGAFVVGALGVALAAVIILGGGKFLHRRHTFVAYFRSTVHGLDKGAPVKFKGVEIGSVADIRINLSKMPTRPEDVRIPVLIALDANKLTSGGANVDLEDPDTLKTYIDQGLRAQLASISFITGLRYVALDVVPGSKVDLVDDPTVPYAEIPTLPGELEGAQKELIAVLGKLSELDVGKLYRSVDKAVGSAQRLLESLNDLVGDVDELARLPDFRDAVKNLREITTNLNAAVTEFRQIEHQLSADGPFVKNLEQASVNAVKALDRAGVAANMISGAFHPDSRLFVQVEQTLGDLSEAARSLRRLTDQLDRDPGALLRGKSP